MLSLTNVVVGSTLNAKWAVLARNNPEDKWVQVKVFLNRDDAIGFVRTKNLDQDDKARLEWIDHSDKVQWGEDACKEPPLAPVV